MKGKVEIWLFVENYYPKYYSCDVIAVNDDLNKIIDGEIEGAAKELYLEIKEAQRIEYLGNISKKELALKTIEAVQEALNESNAYIYEKAIEGYLETLNN